MDIESIRNKFGDDYIADKNTFKMGIDYRFTSHIAERFTGHSVLETCTGAGFTTISLAKSAKHVYTVEIDKSNQNQAIQNISTANLSKSVTFIHGNILDPSILANIQPINSAFIDPDWAD